MDYYKADQGSLMQCVITPAEPYLPKTNEEIAEILDKQVRGWYCTKGPGRWYCMCLVQAD